MNSEKLRYWAELIFIDEKVGTRGGTSIHQEKILQLFTLIQAAKENPTVEVYESIKNYRPMRCKNRKSDQVNYLRYLQHCVNLLDGFVQKDEGLMK